MSLGFFGGGGAFPLSVANADGEAMPATDVVPGIGEPARHEGVADPASVNEPVLLRAGLRSCLLVAVLTGGVGNDSCDSSCWFSRSGDSHRSCDCCVSKKGGTENGCSRSARSSKESWSLLRGRGDWECCVTDILTRWTGEDLEAEVIYF